MKTETVFFGILMKPALNGLIEYYETYESQLSSVKKLDLSRINEELKRISRDSALSRDEEYAEWDILMQEHETKYDMLYANFFRYSFIVLAFLVLEDHLHRFCCALHDAKHYPKAPPNPGSNIVETYKSYILGVGVSVQADLWEGIEELNIIRNCIVHSSGDISRSRKKADLVRISQKGIGIHLGNRVNRKELTPLYLNDNMLMIEPKYCKSVVKEIKVLFEALCKSAKLPTRMRFENKKFVFY